MSYKVFIPCAGTGSRLEKLTENLPKALVEIDNKPTISHIIEKFPSDISIVIALGHKGELIKEYLSVAYTDRNFEFVEIEPFEGKGSGLGLTTLMCKSNLQCPFVFCSCDTIVDEAIPQPDCNWIAYSNLADPLNNQAYRTVEIDNDQILSIKEKLDANNSNVKRFPYIGLAGIHDFEKFWTSLESSPVYIEVGEAEGLRSLENIKAIKFTWSDTGNMDSLIKTRKKFFNPNGPNILEKPNEAIWFIDSLVIKFNIDKNFIADRVKRVDIMGDFVPKIIKSTPHMYAYKKANGEVLSKIIDLSLFKKLLDHSMSFWKVGIKSNPKLLTHNQDFKDVCFKFYKNKTYERINEYYKNFNNTDQEEFINGINTPKVFEMLDSLDWNWLCDGLKGQFHGDFHFENILYDKETNKFTFLDWRQNFGGIIEYGDIYYDFAKLNHGLIVCHELIAKDLFTVNYSSNNIHYDLCRKQILVECENYLKEYLEQNGFDYQKVYLLTALIYLNIAGLHHYPYCHLLYYLGKDLLRKFIYKERK
jgi:choline kinase